MGKTTRKEYEEKTMIDLRVRVTEKDQVEQFKKIRKYYDKEIKRDSYSALNDTDVVRWMIEHTYWTLVKSGDLKKDDE